MKKKYIVGLILFLGVGATIAQLYRSSIQYTSTVYENGILLATNACRFERVFGHNNGPDQFLQIFDSNVAATNGQTCTMGIRVFTNINFSVTVTDIPWTFQRGIYICNSTTNPTRTIGASNCTFYTQHDMNP